MKRLGIDIGGTGIKGGVVDLADAELVGDRYRLLTPDPATPENCASVIREILDHFGWDGPTGIAVPGKIVDGIVRSAYNIDKSWLGVAAAEFLTDSLGVETTVINDADAAGLAEMRWGAGRGEEGLVILLTFGTGIGSAMFLGGRMIANTELGHLQLRNTDVENWASANARKREGLSWKEWAARLTEYFEHLELLFSPSLYIIGGGVSKEADKFIPKIKTRGRIVPARFRNKAGIVGLAYATTLDDL